MNSNDFDKFYAGYMEAIEFTEFHDDNPDLLASLGLADETILQTMNDCKKFFEVARDMIPDDKLETAGIDFWLTRNGHGSGFWAYPEVYGDFTDKLTDLCGWGKMFDSVDVYVGDDNRVYMQ